MCGISGMLVQAGFEKLVNRDNLQKMAESIKYRGPDDAGYYISGPLGFAFRRLSIIDLDNGHQPMCNEDGSVWVIYNGEIYNYASLRKDLIARGHIFKTKTDTETIIHLYEEMGTECTSLLRGMFAFAIWDDKKKMLFCARDRFGIKPFYYSQDPQGFFFGSEIKSFISLVGEKQVLPSALDYYLTYGYTPADQTIFKGIHKLPAGHQLTVTQSNKPAIERYWDIKIQPVYDITEEEWAHNLLEKLRESIKIRLRSDVPLGVLLSGGIDSGAVTALAAELSHEPLKTFSLGFREKEHDELPLTRIISERYQTDHHELVLEPQSLDILPSLISLFDEPFADQSAIPTFFICRYAREVVTVALSGDGGDELFAGYSHYAKFNKINKLHEATGGLLHPLFKLLHQSLPISIPGYGLSYYLSRPIGKLPAFVCKWKEHERRLAYRPEFSEIIKGRRPEDEKIKIINQSKSQGIDLATETDMRTWLIDDVLTKVDRASMANSLEVRVPILDHEFAELAFKIPSSLKLKNGNGKYIFKKALANHLPGKILSQPKRGFGIPLRKWFKNDLQDYLHDTIGQKNSPLNEYIDPRYVSDLIHKHNSGFRDLNQKIWTLVVLHEWLSKFKSH